jgi:predicted anti-sigma-YlaC factor YlaD
LPEIWEDTTSDDGDKAMTHDTFTEKISLWLDNELSAPEIEELQAHLADCPTCQHTYQALQRVDMLLRHGASMRVEPAPGFTTRFETRLAQHQARHNGHVWLGFGVLLVGTLFFFIIGGILLGTFVSAGVNLFGIDILYHGLAGFIVSANTIAVWLNLAGLFLKASLITMSQPLFWGCALVAAGMAWLWLRLLKLVNRPVAVELLI